MRKRILTALASIIATLGVAGTAMSASVEFKGDMNHGIATSNNTLALSAPIKSASTDYFAYNGRLGGVGGLGTNISALSLFGKNTPSNVFGSSRLRWQFEAKSDDGKARFVYSQEVGAVDWGHGTSSTAKENGFGLSGDGVNIETRFAYIDFQVPGMDKNHKIMVGLQPININDFVWRETAAGISYHGKQGENKWQLGWVRGDNGGNNRGGVADADNDYFWAKVEGKPSKEFTLGGFFIYADLGEETSTVATVRNVRDIYDATYWYLGLEGKMESGPFYGNALFVYQGGEIDFQNVNLKSMDRDAWLTNLTLGYKMGENLDMYANFLYVTGDENPFDRDANNFDSIDVDVRIGMMLFKDGFMSDIDRFYSDAPYIGDAGLVNYSIGTRYKLDKQNTIRVEGRYLQTAEDIWWVDKNRKADDLGFELDFYFNHKYNKNLDLKFEAGYLFAGDAIDLLSAKPKKGSDNLYNIILGAAFKF